MNLSLNLEGSFPPIVNHNQEDISDKSSLRVFRRTIGKGGFSTVYSGVVLVENGCAFPVAVKVIEVQVSLGVKSLLWKFHGKPENEGTKRKFSLREAMWEKEVLVQLGDCPFVIDYYGFNITKSKVSLAMEECCHLATKELLIMVDKESKAGVVFYIMTAIADALRIMHERQLIHRDVKPGNILLTWDGIPKLIDYGLSKSLKNDDSSLASDGAGTVFLIPPEVVAGSPHDEKGDGWAFGLTTASFFLGRDVGHIFAWNWEQLKELFVNCKNGVDGQRHKLDSSLNLYFSAAKDRTANVKLLRIEFILRNFILFDVSERYSVEQFCREESASMFLKLWRGEEIESFDVADDFLKAQKTLQSLLFKERMLYSDYRFD